MVVDATFKLLCLIKACKRHISLTKQRVSLQIHTFKTFNMLLYIPYITGLRDSTGNARSE